jgi:hypothetical protein
MNTKKKNKLNFMVLCIAFISIMLIPSKAFASSDSDFVIENGVLKEYKGSDASVTIPDNVVEIGMQAFSNNSVLENISIPTSVKRVETSAFSYCTKLKNVVIPNSVTYLGGSVFLGCTNLEEVVLSNKVDTLRGWLFVECKNLKKVVVPASVKHISYYEIPPFEGFKIDMPKLIVYGNSGSYIQKYCKKQGIPFKIIGKDYSALLDKIKVTSKLNISKSTNKTIKVTIPKGLKKVSKFTGEEGQVKITYKTSNKKIATVNSKGKVTAKNKKGTVKILVTITDVYGSKKTITTKITVK